MPKRLRYALILFVTAWYTLVGMYLPVRAVSLACFAVTLIEALTNEARLRIEKEDVRFSCLPYKDEVRAACPGDDDLDCDLAGVIITSVVVDTPEVLVGFRGGQGWWINMNGDRVGIDNDAEGTIRAGFPGALREWFDTYVAELEAWRDAGEPLRLVCAPERLSTLSDAAGRIMPLPRHGRSTEPNPPPQ